MNVAGGIYKEKDFTFSFLGVCAVSFTSTGRRQCCAKLWACPDSGNKTRIWSLSNPCQARQL